MAEKVGRRRFEMKVRDCKRKLLTFQSRRDIFEIMLKKFSFLFCALVILACSGNSKSSAGPEISANSADSNAANFSSSAGASSLSEILWNTADLTWYESYPEAGSEECVEYNGCEWAGYFAALDDQQSEEWVAAHNIIAIHEKDFDTYKLKTFRLRKGGFEIDAVVYDKCADSDCDGCCTENSRGTGFLIDIESYTRARFQNYGSGVIEWRCLDCE